MVVVYDSLTGQTKRFAQKLNEKIININDDVEINKVINSNLILLCTRTFNFGEIPKSTKNFLDKYSNKVIGVCVSGNKNWGINYGKAGDLINKIYNIPLIIKFEASGLNEDIKYVKEWIKKWKENNNG